MPNIIMELMREIHRVEQLFPSLHGAELDNARRTVGYARHGLANNDLGVMKESVNDLRDITGEPKKP